MLAPGEDVPSEASLLSTFAGATATVTASNSSHSGMTTSSSDMGLSAGVVVGIVVGVIFSLGLCAALCFFAGRTKSLKDMLEQMTKYRGSYPPRDRSVRDEDTLSMYVRSSISFAKGLY
jgi:hypothetical protein